jgi:hypothetical protein
MKTRQQRIHERKMELDRLNGTPLPHERRGCDWARWARATFEVDQQLRQERQQQKESK